MRSVVYMGRSQRTIDSWKLEVAELIKMNLQALQSSMDSAFAQMPDWVNRGKTTDKPLKGAVKGAMQLTVKDGDSYRVVYVAEHKDKIFVLHAFKKKTEGRDSTALKTIETRLKQLKKDRAAKRV